MRSVLAEDCVLDYRGCCPDPATGRDFMAAMNVVLRGRTSWTSDGFAGSGIVSVRQGHHADTEVTGDTTATGVREMTDRLFMPAASPFTCMIDYGHDHDTYVRSDETWRIETLASRIRAEA